jgi:hypothetical protein
MTVVTCMSTTGHLIPPLLVFPRKNMKQELKNGTLHCLDQFMLAIPQGGLQSKIFFPVVSSFHQTYKDDNRSSRESC